MTDDELWKLEEQQLTNGIAQVQSQIDLENLNHRRKISDLAAYLIHLENELKVHLDKKKAV
jgi:hypothetical protein